MVHLLKHIFQSATFCSSHSNQPSAETNAEAGSRCWLQLASCVCMSWHWPMYWCPAHEPADVPMWLMH